jgi:hypothetical protein
MQNDPIFAHGSVFRGRRMIWTGMLARLSTAPAMRRPRHGTSPTTMAGLFAKVRVLAAEDIIDQEEGDAEDILRMIFGDFAALDAAAQPAAAA